MTNMIMYRVCGGKASRNAGRCLHSVDPNITDQSYKSPLRKALIISPPSWRGVGVVESFHLFKVDSYKNEIDLHQINTRGKKL